MTEGRPSGWWWTVMPSTIAATPAYVVRSARYLRVPQRAYAATRVAVSGLAMGLESFGLDADVAPDPPGGEPPEQSGQPTNELEGQPYGLAISPRRLHRVTGDHRHAALLGPPH